MLTGLWSTQNAHAFLVRIKMVQLLWKTVLAASYKVKYTLDI